MVNLIVAVRPIWRTRRVAFEPRIASAAWRRSPSWWRWGRPWRRVRHPWPEGGGAVRRRATNPNVRRRTIDRARTRPESGARFVNGRFSPGEKGGRFAPSS